MAIRKAPPAPFFPETVHGELVLLVVVVYAGDVEGGAKALAPIREIGSPIVDAVGPKPYATFQTMFDAATGAGARNYWKGHYLSEMSDEAIDLMCDYATTIGSPETTIGMMALGGEISRRPAESTAYQHRDVEWVVNVQSRWREAAEDDSRVAWARDLFDALMPHATGGAYVNFISHDEGQQRAHDAFGDVYDRLAAVKAEWDPENVFHLNQNVRPAA